MKRRPTRTLIVYMVTVMLLLSGVFPNAEAWAEESLNEPIQLPQATQLIEQHNSQVQDSTWIIKWKTKELPPRFQAESRILRYYDPSDIVVARPAEGVDLHSWLNEWKRSDSVSYVQRNHTFEIAAKSNDPLQGEQKYLQQIHAEAAWDVAKENKSYTIAIVDTGIDLTHPDLKDNLIAGTNLIDPDKSAQDDNGHGTNIAGVIAAVTNNKEGIAGIVWKAQIMPIKAMEARGRGDEDKLGEGIRYAVDSGVKIIVLSVGLYRYSLYMKEIVQYAEDNGVLLISASGNDGESVKYPAAYPTVLAVGGATVDNKVQGFSNFGSEIDVVAPWNVYTTRLGGGYMFNEGTSMAAPQVAGVAALIWAKYPEMEPYQVRNLIRQTAEDIGPKGWDPYSGYGLLRADRALMEKYRTDIYESNDKRELAKPLPMDAMISAELSTPTDQDWFSIEAPYDGTIELQLIDSEASASDIQLTHYKPESLGKGTVYPNVGSQPVELEVKKGKTWIQLNYANQSQGKTAKYRLVTRFNIYRDAFEDNDRQYKAYTLSAQTQTVRGTFHQVQDEDWFTLTIEQSGSLRMSLTPDTPRMDLELLIQKKDEKPILEDVGEEGEAEIPGLIDVLPGKYYFRIRDVISEESYPVRGEYSFHIDYIKKYIDPNEPNDKSFQAVTMNLNSPYEGVLNTAADQDWFAFKVKDYGVVNIDLSNIPIDRLMSLTLYDQNQKQLAIGINELEKKRMIMEKALQPGTYFIKLSVDRPFEDQAYSLQVIAEKLIAGYRDISQHWAQKAIVEMTNKKILKGYGDFLFLPDRKVTRAEAATMIVKAFNLSRQADINFTDLSEKHWAFASISAAAQAGIVKGYPDKTFAPEQQVTRAEMAMMLANAMKIKGKKNGSLPFKDVKADGWAVPILRQMKTEGWISGYNDGTFKPDSTTTRAEFVSLLYRLTNKKM